MNGRRLFLISLVKSAFHGSDWYHHMADEANTCASMVGQVPPIWVIVVHLHAKTTLDDRSR